MALNLKNGFEAGALLFVFNNMTAPNSCRKMALNLKNGFEPELFSFIFNNMVALNLIFNIFFLNPTPG